MTTSTSGRGDVACAPELRCPIDGAPLRAAGSSASPEVATLDCGTHRWPLVDGVADLRADDPEGTAAAVDACDAADADRAAATLAARRDPWAPRPWPEPSEVLDAVSAHRRGDLGPVPLLRALDFGPVADYFAHRWSAPTLASSAAIAASCPPGPIVDLAAGLGQLGWAVRHRRPDRTNVELVWAKAWVGARRVDPGARWVAADASATGLAETPEPRTVVICDALYFIADAAAVVAEARRLAGPDGSIALGHLHDVDADQVVGGHPRSLAGWRVLLDGGRAHDDADIAAFARGGRPPRTLSGKRHGEHAISVVPSELDWARPPGPPPGTPLRLAALFDLVGSRLCVRWPSAGFRDEYGPQMADVDGSEISRRLAEALSADRAVDHDPTDAEMASLVARGVLVDVPAGWP